METKEDQTDLPRQTIDNSPDLPEINKSIDKDELNKKLNDKEDKEDYWEIWGSLVNDWNNQYKKNPQLVKVFCCFFF